MRVGALAIGAIALLAPDLAAAQCSDAPPVYVAEQLCRYWKRQREDVRASSTCCLPIQKKAKKKQTKALKHNEKARDPKLSQEERSRHLKKANKLFHQRGVLADEFRSCVNTITHALNLEKHNGTSPRSQISLACGGPVDFIGNLGWRPCVDLDRSKFLVDRLVGLTVNSFNCHYYTKSFIQTAVDGLAWTPPNGLSWNDCIRRNDRPGYVRIPGAVHVGDIVLVKGPDAFPCAYHHSGVVIAVNPDGTPKTIRQKDGPDTCVVDLSWDEFKQVWLTRKSIRAEFRTNPNYAGSIPLF